MTNKFSLNIGGLPTLEVPDYCSSGLPNAEGIPGFCEALANLLLLKMDNSNLSIGQKTLLEWNYCFGHLGLQQVQLILRHFPFAIQNFLLLQNEFFPCARFMNLLRPVVAPREDC